MSFAKQLSNDGLQGSACDLTQRTSPSRWHRVLPLIGVLSVSLGGLPLTACHETITLSDAAPFTVEMTASSGDFGSPTDLLPTSQGDGEWVSRTYTFHVRILRPSGVVDTTFGRKLHARVLPGRVEGDAYFPLAGGEGDISVTVSHIFGETRIWLEDVGDEEGTDSDVASFATGVSDIIYVQMPTIPNIQYVPEGDTCLSYVGTTLDGYECAALSSNFVRVRSDDRLLVVTATTTDGFFVSDCTEGIGFDEPCDGANGHYNSIFAFNYSAPKGLFAGAILQSLSGNVTEFNGSTQLSFPEWILEPGIQVTPPQPQVFDEQIYCPPEDGFAQEPYESDLVRMERLVVKDFKNDSNDMSSYNRFGQWPAIFQDTVSNIPCEVAVVTRKTFPSFDPLANPGLELDFVQGNLTTYASVYSDVIQWTLLTRAPEDLGCSGGTCPTN